jgi:hypothetical protein
MNTQSAVGVNGKSPELVTNTVCWRGENRWGVVGPGKIMLTKVIPKLGFPHVN